MLLIWWALKQVGNFESYENAINLAIAQLEGRESLQRKSITAQSGDQNGLLITMIRNDGNRIQISMSKKGRTIKSSTLLS